MNEVQRADTIRGYKVLALLLVFPIALIVLWQSTNQTFHAVLIFLFSVAAVWGLWQYRKRRGPAPASVSAPTNSSAALPANKFELLIWRHQQSIDNYKNRVCLSGVHEVDNLVRDCVGDIAQRECRPDIAPGYQYLYKWRQRTDIPDEYRRLTDYLKTDFQKRADELTKSKDEQIALKAEKILSDNGDLVEKFLELAERKVSVLDDYGDEQWNALPEEITKFLRKLDQRQGLGIHWEFMKASKGENWENTIAAMSWCLPEECRPIPKRLLQIFQEHHERVKSKNTGEADVKDLTGVEFETHVAKLLRSAGYEVQGTPTTGDQGADLIAKKGGRKVIIQAKRYEGAVGNKAVQEVISAVRFYGGDEGWVVTNSTFTPSAVALAQKANVRLIDGIALRSNPIH